ncbi:ALF repeat-containing protein [Streptomyces gilvus]|uniref:ALF repeat-containing protein n=1 Tax=Streptomyces gilvus TaxID=2920937 RepID=UPI001F10C055|nr:ALF repeat-containing protein [Streptomyces sp. CME 23]MCH5677801.1 ALF repeat-containing protein [Streptomyces sp. CME 23]
MRLARAALSVAAVALTPTLLLTTPAFASDTIGTSSTGAVTASDSIDPTTPVSEMSDDDVRVAILRIIADPATGRAVRAAAQAAMDGTIADQRYFLETGRRQAQAEDDRVAVARILYLAQQNGSKAVVRQASAALDAGTPEALRAFLETGYRLAQAEDDRVAIARILADPATSDAVRVAAQAALDDGSPEALRYFLEHGRYEVSA